MKKVVKDDNGNVIEKSAQLSDFVERDLGNGCQMIDVMEMMSFFSR